VFSVGVIISPDSRAYFGMWPYVSGGYPFILRSVYYIFGNIYAVVVVAVQYVAVLLSIWFFMRHFIMQFSLKKYQLILILIFLFYPIFDSNLFVVNNISTEGLSYALFLQLIYFSYNAFVVRSIKSHLLLVLTAALLITIRGQFKFLIPLFLLMELIIWVKTKKINRKAAVIFVMLPLVVFAMDNTYHKIVHNKFFSTPFTWTTLVTSILFVSDEKDVSYVKTEEARIIFKLIHQKINEKGIGYDKHKYFKEPIDYNYIFYHYEYPTLCNQTIQFEALKYFSEKHHDTIQAYSDVERVYKQLFFDLLPHKFSKWFALGFQSFKMGLGGLSVALVFLVSFVLLLVSYFKTGEQLFLFLAFLLLIILTNRVLVSISVHSIIRYFFYTNWIPVLLLFIGINKLKFNVE